LGVKSVFFPGNKLPGYFQVSLQDRKRLFFKHPNNNQLSEKITGQSRKGLLRIARQFIAGRVKAVFFFPGNKLPGYFQVSLQDRKRLFFKHPNNNQLSGKNMEHRALINIIKARANGEEHDVEEYFSEIEKLIRGAYLNRIAFFRDRIDSVEFSNKCWDKTEDELLYKLRDIDFTNDYALKKYILICFENLLLGMIENFTEGTNRIKQFRRVLKSICLLGCILYCNCWKMGKYRNRSLQPASLEELKQKASVIIHPKTHSSARGEYIKAADMESYLISVIDSVGGMTYDKDLFMFIRETFSAGITVIIREGDIKDAKGEELDFEEIIIMIGKIPHEDPFPGQEHFLIAGKIYDDMNRKHLVDIFYQYVIEEKKMETIAAEMEVAVSTVSEKVKKLKTYLKKHIETESLQREEWYIVFYLISERILSEKGKTHPHSSTRKSIYRN